MLTTEDKNPGTASIDGVNEAVKPYYGPLALKAAVLALAFVVLYSQVFTSLVRMWWSSDDYSHGFIVPFISLYMIWSKREALGRINISPNLVFGVPVLLASGLILIAGKLGGVIRLQEISLIVMASGLVLTLLGRFYLRVLALPLAYLFFMIKVLGDGPEKFHWPFQLLAANIGIGILHTLGFPAYHEAQFIQLPNMTLEVASACSGVRFLISIIAIGIPLAFFTQRTLARRVLLIAFGVVTAIIMNGVRVAFIGVWVYYGGSAVHGPLHVFQGVFVAWFGFAALFAGAWFLSRGDRKLALTRKGTAPGHGTTPWRNIAEASGTSGWRNAWVASLLVITLTGAYYYLHRVYPAQMRPALKNLPMAFDGWRAQSLNPSTESLRLEAADDEVLRVYSRADGSSALFYMGYFEQQWPGKQLVSYLTSWRFHRNETQSSITTSNGLKYTVNRAVLHDGADKRVVYFWYDINGRFTPSRYKTKLWSLWDSLSVNRDNGAIIAVSAPFYLADETDAAGKRALDLTARVITDIYERSGMRP